MVEKLNRWPTMEEVVSSLNPRPTRAFLCAFDASLPFFERVALPVIRGTALTEIEIIVDQIGYLRTRFEASATTAVGIEYRTHAVRLGTGHGRFHPKLYLFSYEGGAHAIVSSANVTPSGWRSNLEILDVLRFDVRLGGDRTAFASIADFLERLPTIVGNKSDELASLLTREANRLRALIEPSANAQSPKENVLVLHNLAESLLSQLKRFIGAAEITEVIGVSPFYDAECAVIEAIRTAFPRASIRIIKDGRFFNDIDGSALEALGAHISVDGLHKFGKDTRALHAKCLVLAGPKGAWLVCGSANLTAPAWLLSAQRGGNVEMVTLRVAAAVSTRGAKARLGITALLDALSTKAFALSDLSYAGPLEDEDLSAQSSIEILVAQENAGQLTIVCGTSAVLLSAERIRVHLRSPARMAVSEMAAIVDGPRLSLRVSQPSRELDRLFEDDLGIAATVEAISGGEVQARGFRWLDRLSLSSLSPELRSRRRAFANLLEGRDDGETLLGAFMGLLDLAQQHPSAFLIEPIDDQGEPEPADTDDTVQGQNRLGYNRRAASRDPVSAFRGILGRLLAPIRPSKSPMPAMLRVGDPETGTDDLPKEEKSPPTSTDVQLFLAASDRAHDLIRELTNRADVDQSALVRSVGPILIHIADFLVRVELWALARNMDDTAEKLRWVRQAAWNSIWSIASWETGETRAWMPQRWLNPTVREDLRGLLANPNVLARVLIGAAACSVLDKQDPIVVAELWVPISLVAGGAIDPHSGSLEVPLKEQAETAARMSANRIEAAILLHALQPAGIGDTFGARELRKWQPIRRYVLNEIDYDAAIAALPPALSIQLKVSAKRRFAPLRATKSGLMCDACDTVLSTHYVQLLKSPETKVLACESCGSVLVPVAWDAEIVAAMSGMTHAWKGVRSSSADIMTDPPLRLE